MTETSTADRSDELILVTGASGRVGTVLRPRLREAGLRLRLLDLKAPDDRLDDEDWVEADIRDRGAVAAAMTDVTAVLHLAGLSVENHWDEILSINIAGTQVVLQAAVDAGIRRVVLASSNHAVGFWTRADAGGIELAPGIAPRPDTFYGWSKAAGESLGRLYHDRFGIDVVALRIGSCAPTPPGPRGLSTWLSPDDTGRLAVAALTSHRPDGFRIVWGISANQRRWWSLAEGADIGYVPRDDAEEFADELLDGVTWDTDEPNLFRVGGHFTEMPLGEPVE
ncbi:NAD-dependent epimerase/dehydratase family protein [Millisia brevis]|uniref:NAD-dependent epimerase/dehydratase family protein n=1 Tax=Millisia brevis TaxID=264148 RepID=UPI00083673BE|nr:NAD(P)-dependent oxidoreductase [Millisia brevis]